MPNRNSSPGISTAEQLHTSCGIIPYTLTRKRVRNINLRVRSDGSVHISAPARMPKRDVETFLADKASWVQKHRQQAAQTPPPAPPLYTKQQCLARFSALSDTIYPLFASLLGGQKPALKVRDMKTRWGSCHVQKRIITLNMRLLEKPLLAQEYVVLHEYVHFLHPNHGTAFHAEMARLMPDYKQRKKLLK